MLDHPNGVGPYQLRHHTGVDPHQVYINAFASYGWLGGAAYLALVLSTIAVGFRFALVRAPWGPYLIVAFATFFGTVAQAVREVMADDWTPQIEAAWAELLADIDSYVSATPRSDVVTPAFPSYFARKAASAQA